MLTEITLGAVLSTLGLEIAGHALYEKLASWIKNRKSDTPVTQQELAAAIASFEPSLSIEKTTLLSKKLIEMNAKDGLLFVTRSTIDAAEIKIGAEAEGRFVLEETQTKTTAGSSISMPPGASIVGTGKSGIHQDKDGNMIFNVG